ncbi:MAG TPA: hypothetical protein VIM61_11815 [Chthoniobacterales bacterium]|jgi:hypothetical protein
MKIDPALLDDVLSRDAGLRETTRRQVLRLSRSRRRARARRRMLVAGALVVAAVALFLRLDRPALRGEGAKSSEPTGFAVVRSQPLPASEIVTTQGELFAPVGSSFAGLTFLDTRPLDIRITETRLAMPVLNFLDDRQLLAAFPGRRAALIDAGTERARLIFY